MKLVLPGSIRTRSHPNSTNQGQSKSANNGAASRRARDVRGANLLAAKPTAKCPMNTGVDCSRDRHMGGTEYLSKAAKLRHNCQHLSRERRAAVSVNR